MADGVSVIFGLVCVCLFVCVRVGRWLSMGDGVSVILSGGWVQVQCSVSFCRVCVRGSKCVFVPV